MSVASGGTPSRLGFGTASLMRIPSGRGRRDLLAAAVDSGITHFDTARMYGLGQVERELGRFIAGRRSEVTIATKFGIDASGRLGPLSRLQAPARAMLERFPAARRAIKRRSESFAEPRRYDVATARTSLELSLRQLGIDHLDLLFIHDPTPIDQVDAAELVEFFAEQRAAGRIGAWGVSQDAHPGLDVVGRLGPDAVLQIRDDVVIRPSTGVGDGSFTFGVLGRAHAQITAALRGDPQRAARWRAELGFDPLSGGRLAELLLADALDANRTGTVVYSTLKAARLATAARVAEQPTAPGVSVLRQLVAGERSVLEAQEI